MTAGKEEDQKGITVKKNENFSDWYTEVIIKSGFMDYSPVSGMIVFRPDAYFVWEEIYKAVDARFKKNGVQNTYFPLLIPERLLKKEEKHVEHFKAEVGWVTHGGDTKLEERLAIRPTSETLMYEVMSKWIRSWRDLPMKLNQWNNVVRWEFKHPTPFLRTREFLWNEGHSAYETEEEALRERDLILGIYESALKDLLALPCIVGRKTEQEKFAGGVASYSMEMLMPDGKAVQGPAWHFDGQNFAKAFEMSFLDKDGNKAYVWQSTYAIATRVLGVMVAMHGDDKGLVIPPSVSRIQIVIVPIYRNENRDLVMSKAKEMRETLGRKFRVHLDDRDDRSPGRKYNEWELKGVPIRLEIGERDISAGKVVAVRRDTAGKSDVPMAEIEGALKALLKNMNKDLYSKAQSFMKGMVSESSDYAEMKDILQKRMGVVCAPWCGSEDCENKMKDETGAKIINMSLGKKVRKGAKCVYCGKDARHMANFAKSY
ncbi:MAG: proline--tRNA ligase [Candidatus Marsarchaeota archaeon]|nr:proline--tRNA ligase [Candidatus Marsarchaeota archaeon]